MLLLIILVVLVVILFGGGLGVRGHERYGDYSGAGIGLGGILLLIGYSALSVDTWVHVSYPKFGF